MKTVEDFKQDIMAEVAPAPDPSEGRGKPNLKGLLGKIDKVLDEFGPTISSLAPVQYRAVLALVIGIINAADAKVNGA